ncbi:hypothetical protein BH20ACI2_BH20ACI2_05340 [soil metagenome]
MKNVLSAALLATFVIAPISATFGQRSGSFEKRFTREWTERAQFGLVSAVGDRRGVLVRWETVAEPDTIGFYVYRIENGVSTLVSDTMTLGTTMRPGSDARSGDRYQIYDPYGKGGSSYLIESYSLDGGRSYSKQIDTRSVRDVEEFTGVSIGELREASLSKSHDVESSALILTDELENTVESSLQAADPATHAWVVAQPGASISVRREGMHRVSRAALEAASFPVNSNSANWRLFMEGVEHSMIVGPGEQYIEFYGKGIDTMESDSRVYYLIAATTPGRRIPSRVLRPVGGNVLSQSFSTGAVKKERTLYYDKVLNGEAENHWGRVISTSAAAVPFSLPGVDFAASTATITVKLQGFTNVPHQVNTSVNGNALGIITGTSLNSYSMTVQVPTSSLVEGNNTLNLASIGSGDFSLFDAVTVVYKRKYVANQNVLSFSTPGYRRADLQGFSSTNVRVFDITFDGHPQQIKNASVVQDGASFTAKLPAARAAVYYAVEDSALLAPTEVVANNPSTLATPGNAANLVIISHSAADFMAAAEAWANYRRAEGYIVKVIDVRDVYDEFNYGAISALSIRSFLNYAFSNWQTPPQYVLLMGDSSYDPRNYEGLGYWNLIPSRFVPSYEGTEAPSDEALADFNNDGLAELAIGRIPARTAAHITNVLNKTMLFETPAMQSFDRGSLFAYDEPKGFNFATMSQSIRDKLPLTMPSTMVDRLAPNSATTLLQGLNSGKYIVNYAGHGSAGVWQNSGFFGLAQAEQITNTPTIFTMLTCYNGYFIRPNFDSLSERLLNSPVGGSVVSWASTTATTPDVQMVMAQRFYDRLAVGSITRVGDLIRDAKLVVPSGSDVRYSWVLLGDPLLKTR